MVSKVSEVCKPSLTQYDPTVGLLSAIRSRLSLPVMLLIGAVTGCAAVFILFRTVDATLLERAIREAGNEPLAILLALSAFALAFVVRALAWQRLLPQISFTQALGGIHLALGGNHVLPLRIGETFRVLSVVRRHGLSFESATATTVTLRTADIITVGLLGLITAPVAFTHLLGWVGWTILISAAAISGACWRWLRNAIRRGSDILMPDLLALALSASAWLAECLLVWTAADWAGLKISWPEAAFVTSAAVIAQIAAIAPGGFGTYEAATVAAYLALGQEGGPALVAALSAHALKTAYSLAAGFIAFWVPSPAVIGHLRLKGQVQHEPSPISSPDGPILLFMPAYNEEASIENCLRRCPKEVCGRNVEVLVIDDGSTDSTAAIATQAGAEVLSVEHNTGLGAAVRVGLRTGVERNASVVAFLDADGEYPPEELVALARPILEGEADYVVGSRFAGHIEHMRLHRRIGNMALTLALSFVARRRITDGQTGYRAFSLNAASNAEIIHDFNYAQVLTLNLLGKGYRYLEVPISYHFRTAGDSFVKLGPYLRKVVPAVYRELNRPELTTKPNMRSN